eukprot:CAMPEP_0181220694 /NCGR_PEP_ID=MMETSP1096-20121128/28976_1 /TAXON_ID=156174 ORGANISM="Chrysochromulina ericina, Strain CCMP281" /NCGR_SAMPLE_ID=MMETSP1096 /ASSEMBLY_ACC=CAM_ASM_000453 /LENGTH=140 /DNA_ID=CAMNT_0023313219 /DNA_START=485 /DNA_END=908 /DNA_ORIENTATION=-
MARRPAPASAADVTRQKGCRARSAAELAVHARESKAASIYATASRQVSLVPGEPIYWHLLRSPLAEPTPTHGRYPGASVRRFRSRQACVAVQLTIRPAGGARRDVRLGAVHGMDVEQNAIIVQDYLGNRTGTWHVVITGH